jgi:hypothetical protein
LSGRDPLEQAQCAKMAEVLARYGQCPQFACRDDRPAAGGVHGASAQASLARQCRARSGSGSRRFACVRTDAHWVMIWSRSGAQINIGSWRWATASAPSIIHSSAVTIDVRGAATIIPLLPANCRNAASGLGIAAVGNLSFPLIPVSTTR